MSTGRAAPRCNALASNAVSYNTDCLKSFNSVADLVNSSLKCCDEFCSVIKYRVAAEESYAKQMSKAATMSLEYDGKGMLQCAFDQMKADMNHCSAQHQILADNLKRDVHGPVAKLKAKLQDQHAVIQSQSVDARRQLVALESSWQAAQTKYEQLYLEACRHFALCLELGLPHPVLTTDMFEATPDGKIGLRGSLGSTSPHRIAPPSLNTSSISGENVLDLLNAASEAGGRAAESFREATTGKRFIPAELPDKSDASQVADKALYYLQQAELARFKSRNKWNELCTASQRLGMRLQAMLNKYQSSQELFVQVMADHLKKIVVFESSTIANMQYDIQMLFKVIEDVNPEGDIFGWIQEHTKKNNGVTDFVSSNIGHCDYVSCWDLVAPALSSAAALAAFLPTCSSCETSLSADELASFGGATVTLLQLNVTACEPSGERTFRPPLDKILRTEDLHNSLNLCHYIVGNVSPPSVTPDEACQSLLLPRLMSSSSLLNKGIGYADQEELIDMDVLNCNNGPIREPTMGKADVVLQELLILSKAMSAQWTDELDPYEKVVVWLKDIQAASGKPQLYRNRGCDVDITTDRVEYDDFSILMDWLPPHQTGEVMASSMKKAVPKSEYVKQSMVSANLPCTNDNSDDDAY